MTNLLRKGLTSLIRTTSAADNPLAGQRSLIAKAEGWVDRTAAGVETPISPNAYNASLVAQGPGFATDTYLAGSFILGASRIKAGSMYRVRIHVSKTAAGVAAPVFTVRHGAAGTTADASRGTLTFAAQTAVAESGVFEVLLTFRTGGAATSYWAAGQVLHVLANTGLTTSNNGNTNGFSAANFDTTAATFGIGISVNAGASSAWTTNLVQAELINLA